MGRTACTEPQYLTFTFLKLCITFCNTNFSHIMSHYKEQGLPLTYWLRLIFETFSQKIINNKLPINFHTLYSGNVLFSYVQRRHYPNVIAADLILVIKISVVFYT
jgi:hypothetical protein